MNKDDEQVEDFDNIEFYNECEGEDGEPKYLSDGVWILPNGKVIHDQD